MNYLRLILTLLVASLSFPGGLVAKDLVWSEAEQFHDLSDTGDYLHAQDNNLTFDQIRAESIQWLPKDADADLSAHGIGALWRRIQVHNPSLESIKLTLNNAYNQTDEFFLYQQNPDGTIRQFRAGDRVVHKTGEAIDKSLAFHISLPPGTSTLYIKTYSRGLVSDKLSLWTQRRFSRHNIQSQIFVAVHIGALVVLAFYNLFLFVSLKSKVYLYYVAYLIPFIAVQLIFTGQADLLLPETEWRVWFLNEGLHFSIKLALGFSVLFTLNFLKMASYHRSGSLILRGMAFILFVSVLATFLIPYRLDSMFVALTTVISSFILIGCGIIATYRGFRPALYYSAAWFFLLLGSSVVALKAYGVLPINLFTTWAQLTGSTLEGVLLSLALGERFNTFQRQATRERESYIARLEAKEKENRHSYQQLAKIVYPHQLKMIKEGSALEQTMPTGESEAVVICFDTVASSRLDPNYSRTFMSEVFQRCYDRMYEDYDMLAQTSSAYRIKEMGDGFLCSVGFPLPMTQSASPATLAFELAIAFTEIFDQVAENYPFASPPHCSIGIASGQVEAFYPVAGVREYDLYGPAIILADRYESLRKVVFGPWLSNNIGVLSESVYDQLDATSKEILMGYNLTDHGIQVRDDEGAKWFHYCFVKLGKIGSKLTNDKGYGQPA